MLALNKILQKTNEKLCIQFSQARYVFSGAISALFTKKTDIKQLIFQQSNLLIKAIKSIDQVVMGVNVLKYCQRLKVHEMSPNRFLKKEKMELLKRKIELATKIQLKTLPYWLISENCLKKQQKSSNK